MTSDDQAMQSELIQDENKIQEAPIENEANGTIDEEKVLLKSLKAYFKLCSAAEDKGIFLKDPVFCTMLATFVSDSRVLVVHYVAKILVILTEKSENVKIVYQIEGIYQAIGDACDRYLPARVVHNLLVVHSRLNTLKRLEINDKNYTKLKSNQLVYHIIDNEFSEHKQHLVEQSCLAIRGVTSIGFTYPQNFVKCEVMVKEMVQPKVVEKCILGCGYDSIVRVVKLDNGMTQAYDVYADEHTDDDNSAEKEKNMPQYLDDIQIEPVDEKHGIVPIDYVYEKKSSWLGKLTSYLW